MLRLFSQQEDNVSLFHRSLTFKKQIPCDGGFYWEMTTLSLSEENILTFW
jgi:hypothetical protein